MFLRINTYCDGHAQSVVAGGVKVPVHGAHARTAGWGLCDCPNTIITQLGAYFRGGEGGGVVMPIQSWADYPLACALGPRRCLRPQRTTAARYG